MLYSLNVNERVFSFVMSKIYEVGVVSDEAVNDPVWVGKQVSAETCTYVKGIRDLRDHKAQLSMFGQQITTIDEWAAQNGVPADVLASAFKPVVNPEVDYKASLDSIRSWVKNVALSGLPWNEDEYNRILESATGINKQLGQHLFPGSELVERAIDWTKSLFSLRRTTSAH
jgi:hypothetical protein